MRPGNAVGNTPLQTRFLGNGNETETRVSFLVTAFSRFRNAYSGRPVDRAHPFRGAPGTRLAHDLPIAS